MESPPFDVVAFDLDGTLADTSDDLAAALNHALACLGRPALTTDRVRRLVGHGTRVLMLRGLEVTGGSSEALMEAGLTKLLAHYERFICEKTAPYPGAAAALDELAERQVRLAICTNKPEHLTRKLVAELGWTDRFAAIVGGDTLERAKPHPAPLMAAIERAGSGNAAFVGDSITDAETARAARLPFVAVSFGFSDRPVDELFADAVIDHFDALGEALARLGREASATGPALPR